MQQRAEPHIGSAAPARLLDVDALAGRLAIKRRLAYELADRGDIASVKVGRLLRFRPEDVEAYILENLRGTR